MSNILLLRHGQAAPAGIMAGARDFALTDAGRAEMRAWGSALAALPIGLLFCSPLRRARESAEIIAAAQSAAPAPAVVPELREISLGVWENMPKAEVMRLYPQEWQQRGNDFAACAPPGGESFNTLAARVLPAFEALYPKMIRHDYVLLAAHQSVNRVILHHLGMPGSLANGLRDIPQDCAALNRLELRRDGATGFVCRPLSINERPSTRQA